MISIMNSHQNLFGAAIKILMLSAQRHQTWLGGCGGVKDEGWGGGGTLLVIIGTLNL